MPVQIEMGVSWNRSDLDILSDDAIFRKKGDQIGALCCNVKFRAAMSSSGLQCQVPGCNVKFRPPGGAIA